MPKSKIEFSRKVKRLSISRISSASRKYSTASANSHSAPSVPISSSGRLAALSRKHPQLNADQKQKQPIGRSELCKDITLEDGTPSLSVSESGTQQNLQNGVVDTSMLPAHIGAPLASPSSPELFDFRGLTCFPEENNGSYYPISSPFRLSHGAAGIWNARAGQLPPQPHNGSYASTYIPFIPQPVNLYPGPMYHEYGGPFYQPQHPYPGQVQAQESYDNIDPALRPSVTYCLPEINEVAPPQYSEAVPNHFYTYPVHIPTVPVDEKVVETAQENITAEDTYEFIVETPLNRKPRVRRARRAQTLGFRKQAGTGAEVGMVPGMVISAPWLSKALAWKITGYVKKTRKLFETVHFDEPCVYEAVPVHVDKEDLPEIPCPMAGCDMLLKGREELFRHLKDSSGDHKLIVNNNVGQIKVPCKAEDGCSAKVIAGGMARHLVESHSNVWIYCTMCDKAMTRRDQMKEHFKKAHAEPEMPTHFREVLHRNYDDAEMSDADEPDQ